MLLVVSKRLGAAFHISNLSFSDLEWGYSTKSSLISNIEYAVKRCLSLRFFRFFEPIDKVILEISFIRTYDLVTFSCRNVIEIATIEGLDCILCLNDRHWFLTVPEISKLLYLVWSESHLFTEGLTIEKLSHVILLCISLQKLLEGARHNYLMEYVGVYIKVPRCDYYSICEIAFGDTLNPQIFRKFDDFLWVQSVR